MNQRSKIGPTADEKSQWQMNNSEYNKRYHSFSSEEQGNAKPPAVRQQDNRDTFRLGNDMLTASSYMTDYANKPQDQPNRVKHRGGPSSIAAPPGATMDCNSSYGQSFDKKECRPAQPIKPPPPQGLGWKTESGENQTNVTNNDKDYRHYTSEEIGSSKRQPIIISPEYGAIDTNPNTRPQMDFSTTVSNNFVKHEGNCRPAPAPGSIKTPANGIAGIAGADINAKMDLTTTHQRAYHNKALDDTLVAVPPLAKDKRGGRPKWYTNGTEGANHSEISTQMNDYISHTGVSRPKSFQPKMEYSAPEKKFHTQTLYGGAFTIKGNHQRRPMVPAVRTKDDEIIKSVCNANDVYSTEYDQTYKEAPNTFRKPAAIVPKTSNKSAGKFYEGTSYSQNFNCDEDRNVPRAQSYKPTVKPNSNVGSPWSTKANFDSEQGQHFKSTTQEHYQGETANPASICRPKIKKDWGGEKSGEVEGNNEREVQFETEYNKCFSDKQDNNRKNNRKNLTTPRDMSQK